jgi:hypothetical protein
VAPAPAMLIALGVAALTDFSSLAHAREIARPKPKPKPIALLRES